MDQEKIGKFIKQIRQDHHLTQKDLAEKLGVTYQAVSKWENGKNIPDIAILQIISKEFNVNIDEILEGKRKKEKIVSFNYLLIILLIILGISIIISINIYVRKNNNFEFKTISSKCSDFKITGSAAYNKQQTAIYISNIEFCGKEDHTNYKRITCTLYENYQNTKTKISSCPEKKNKTLESFLKETKINVENYSSNCKKLTSNTLSLEIKAINEETKTITYTIPIKLNDTCK